jgi:hypothetical protein
LPLLILEVLFEVVHRSPPSRAIAQTLLSGFKNAISGLHCVSDGALPEGCKAMNFRGLAKFMLDAAAEGSHGRKLLGIGR